MIGVVVYHINSIAWPSEQYVLRSIELLACYHWLYRVWAVYTYILLLTTINGAMYSRPSLDNQDNADHILKQPAVNQGSHVESWVVKFILFNLRSLGRIRNVGPHNQITKILLSDQANQ